MTTKAEAMRVEQQRAAHRPKPKAPPKRRRDVPADTSLLGVSATDRKPGNATRNLRASPKQGAALEDWVTGPRSRKSTRRSVGRVKPASNLQRREIRKTSSPSARAARAIRAKA
jgi:hypothetical protein